MGLVEIFLGGGEADADTNEAGAGGVVRVERLRGFWGGTEVARVGGDGDGSGFERGALENETGGCGEERVSI